MMDLSKLLTDFRKEKGLNQPEMADFLEIGERTYQTIEKTGDAVKVETLLSILKKIEISPAQFFAGVSDLSVDNVYLTRSDKIELYDFLRIKAFTFTYLHAIAKLMSRVNGLSLEDCVTDLENETKLNLREILGL